MKTYGFGVDLGGTTVKIGFFKNDGTMLDKWEIATRKENEGAFILDDIAGAIKGKLAAEGINPSDVQGIGLGVPGPVRADGTVLKCVNLGWGILNVEQALSEKTGLPVKAGNDANVAALGEMWMGGGKGYKNLVMVTLGTGVGGGVIVDGKIISGAHGAAGEIGHSKVSDTETDTCGCGKKGCLEQYASATGIVRVAKRRLQKDDTASTLRSLEEITAKDVFDKAKEGDTVALEIAETATRILGTALANVSAVVDPEIYVIGGGVSKAGDILLENIQKHFKERCFEACTDTQFALASLGNDAGMYGCARLIFEP